MFGFFAISWAFWMQVRAVGLNYEIVQEVLDEANRIKQAKDMQRRIIEKAHWIPGLWWTRLEVRSARIKNYEPHHSHWMNRSLEDVWMTKKE